MKETQVPIPPFGKILIREVTEEIVEGDLFEITEVGKPEVKTIDQARKSRNW